ncbi:MAG: nucleotide exchange factor GrpE [Clostridiales bacterium]|jgi:molecular chaperone GrpE|nr:nucleotide exchange factor GrpE [Clostridiales bacterium]
MGKAKKDNISGLEKPPAAEKDEISKIEKLPVAKKDESEPEEPPAAVTADEAGEASPLQELEKALQAEKEKYLRLAAEYDNYRKRSLKEKEALFIDIRCDTIAQILPVYDNLARALSQECSDEAFYKGIEMTMTQLKDILRKCGVKEIPAVGEPFNPEVHNAIMHTEDPAYGASTITEEFEKGFMLGDRVIRHALVKVAN